MKFRLATPDETRDYYIHVMVTMKDGVGSMYGMDDMRVRLHRAMCAVYGLTEAETEKVTSHMDKYERGGGGADAMHSDLCGLVEKKRGAKGGT